MRPPCRCPRSPSRPRQSPPHPVTPPVARRCPALALPLALALGRHAAGRRLHVSLCGPAAPPTTPGNRSGSSETARGTRSAVQQARHTHLTPVSEQFTCCVRLGASSGAAVWALTAQPKRRARQAQCRIRRPIATCHQQAVTLLVPTISSRRQEIPCLSGRWPVLLPYVASGHACLAQRRAPVARSAVQGLPHQWSSAGTSCADCFAERAVTDH